MPEGTSGNVAVYVHSKSDDPTAAETMVHVAENISFTGPPPPQRRGSSQSLGPALPRLLSQGSSMMESMTRLKSTLSENVFAIPPPAPYCYWVAAMACLNSCNLGYDVGSVGGAALLMQEEFGWSSWQLSFYVGSMNFFCIAGSLNAGYVCDRFGRRHTFTISCTIFIAGILIQVMATNFALAMSGRILIGIGVGLGLSIDALYISEIAPPTHRGHLVSFSEVAINVGILLGFVSNYAFLDVGPGLDWRLMLGLGMVMPSILILLSLTVMPESPRWLLMQGRREEAMVVLRKTYVEGSDVEGIAAQIEHHIQADFAADAHSSWHVIFRPTRPVQMMLMAGIGLAACQQLTGCESLIYYSPIFLEKAGFVSKNAAFGMTILVGASKTIFCIVAALYVDQAGRRPLLFLSTGGLFVFLVVMAVACRFDSLGWLMVVGMCAYVSMFSLGVGPLTWVGTTEVFSTRIRAKAMSLATSTNRLIAGLVASSTLPLVEALTPTGYFLFYACITLCTAAYLYAFFPETKGKSLEQVEEYFENQSEREEVARRRKKEGRAARRDGAMAEDTKEEEVVEEEAEEEEATAAEEVEGGVVEVR